MNKYIKILLFITIIILISIIGYVLYNSYMDKYYDYYDDIVVSYKDGKNIKFNNFNDKFEKEKTIIIENNSNNRYTYSLEWVDVSNGIKKQNDFLYTITGTGERVGSLKLSQVPVVDYTVFTQVLIEPKSKQTYTIKFKYNGSEDKAKFNGKIIIKANVVDDGSISKTEV